MEDNKKYYIALTGAIKNVGDFLITERAIALLKGIAPDFNYLVKPSWIHIEDLELTNKSEGIIILGGPGYQVNMYPVVYKLSNNINDIKVPIYILGGGWYGKPGDKTSEKLYRFTKSSKVLLSKIESTYAGLSCRDYQTLRVLESNGFNNITMTGCPVWYDMPSLGKRFEAPKKIKRLVFTPAQNNLFSKQNMEVMKYLKKHFIDTEIIVSFHRGIGKVDEYTTVDDAQNTELLAEYGYDLGFEIKDTAYDANKIRFYSECDFHVGYRVHAHIYFLSKRLPSILLHEDGRGNGVTETLDSPGINAYKVTKTYENYYKLFEKNNLSANIYRKVYGRYGLKTNEDIIGELSKLLANIEKENYRMYVKTIDIIDKQYYVMEDFIKNMVYKVEGNQ